MGNTIKRSTLVILQVSLKRSITMNEFISTKEAYKVGGSWIIPLGAKKPADERKCQESQGDK